MNRQQFSRKWVVLLVMAVIVLSACNLFSNLLNPVGEAISEIKDISEQVDIEDLKGLQENLGTMVPEITVDFDSIQADAQATVEAFQKSLDQGEVPADIPIVDAPIENLFASEAFVSYTTSLDFERVLAFYQEQMPKDDWQSDDKSSFIMGETAILNFSKSGRNVIVTISTDSSSESTTVLITIQPK